MRAIILELSKRRRHVGMSIAELSRRSGVPRPNISRIERGLVDPRLSTIERLLAALTLGLDVTPRRPVGLEEVLARAEQGGRALASEAPRQAASVAASEHTADDQAFIDGLSLDAE
jgi:transcriptional regulator with XRE-family HTH domain